MSEDEEDKVIDEIPVILTHDLEEQLYVFQYPVVPASVESEIGHVLKSQIRPENQQVLLEISLDTSSINYDKLHGEQIASSLEKEGAPTERSSNAEKVMDRIQLASSCSLSDRDSYAIGTVKDNQLFITPIRGVLSLRPELSHLESPAVKKDGAEELEQVRVQFTRTESDRVKQLREQSYRTYAKRIAQEKWFSTEYYDASSSLSLGMRKKLMGSTREAGVVELTREGYLDSVTPQEEEHSAHLPALPDTFISLSSLSLLSTSDRVKLLLKEARTVSLSQLVWMCREDASKVLPCVQECAVLVQGNWVLRSDILFPKDTFSSHNGVPAEAMLRARDYILYHLNKAQVLERKSLAALVKIPTEELKDIMSQVAVLKQNKLWHFRLPKDEAFIQKYPQIVEREERLWAARFERLMESLGEVDPKPPPPPSPRKKERRRKDSSVSSSGDEEMIGKPSTVAKPSKPSPRKKTTKSLPTEKEEKKRKNQKKVNGVCNSDAPMVKVKREVFSSEEVDGS